MNKKNLILFLILLAPVVLFLSPGHAHASLLDTIVNGIKNIFSPSQLSVTSQITLSPDGDLNKNGQIDAGDTITFIYKISNPTNITYTFATLKTNIDTKALNTINNVQGVTSLGESNNTITIPNLTISSNQVRTIHFDARVNLYKDANKTISTQPVLVDKSNSTVFSGQTTSVTAYQIDLSTFNKFVHMTQ